MLTASFLEFLRDTSWAAALLGKVVAVGELAIGAMLFLGIFTGIAAALGAALNFSFMFSGSAGVNPAYLLAMVLLVAGWRVAGQLGADRWLLGRVRFGRHTLQEPPAELTRLPSA